MACSCSCPCHSSPHLLSPPSSAPPPPPHTTPLPTPSTSTSTSSRYRRSESLTQIYESAAYRFQLELWQDEDEAFQSEVDRKEAKCKSFQNEMYQLFGMYFMFQGVLFTAVAQSSILSCEDRWSPVSLSFIASLATIFAVIQKLANIANMKEDIQQTKDRANAVYDKIAEMKMKGLYFNLDDPNTEPESRLAGKIVQDSGGYCQIFSGYGIAVIVFLLSFSAFTLVSCVKVLCRGCKCPSS